MPDETTPSAVCPVDHKAREAWLKTNATHQHGSPRKDGATHKSGALPALASSQQLGTERQVSTIPRAFDSEHASSSKPTPTDTTASAHAHGSLQGSPNAQTADPHTSKGGFWLYPSEEMFFNAMKRKQHEPSPKDMPSVIPIHNAVNERTWQEILRWEKSQGSFEKCGGPKLVSFKGDSTRLTPRARFFSLVGYQAPFDRHDWVIDRCGTKVDYVIDFYQGKGHGGTPLSFYLDVRPKLNTWEGWRMRLSGIFGF